MLTIATASLLFLTIQHAAGFSLKSSPFQQTTTKLSVTTSEPAPVSSFSSDTPTADVAQQLLTKVCDRFQTKGLSGTSAEIEALIEELVNRHVLFDPTECLNGPLYAVQYIDLGAKKTPPSWVKYTTHGSIVGQRYQLQDPNSIERLNVLNYAEAFGGGVKIKSEGGCTLGKDQEPVLPNVASPPKNRFQRLFGNDKNNNEPPESVSTPLLKCPVDYIVPPKSQLASSCTILGLQLFQFDIEGEGTVRVLYADKNMRIFEAPRTEANWEPRGIRTVQVRVNLVDPDFEMV